MHMNPKTQVLSVLTLSFLLSKCAVITVVSQSAASICFNSPAPSVNDWLPYINFFLKFLLWLECNFPLSFWGSGPPQKSLEPPHVGQHCRLNTSGQINPSHPSNIDSVAHIKVWVLNFKKAAVLISWSLFCCSIICLRETGSSVLLTFLP